MYETLESISDTELREEYVNRFARKVGERLQKSSAVANHLRATLSSYARDTEHFVCIFLNSQLRIIATEVVSTGTINSAAVYPREIVKRVLGHEAAHIILGHNHPSNDTDVPSSSDRAVTKKIATVLSAMDVDILDHVIIGADGYMSFSDAGLL
jgi:DNA repair protein RadC